MQELVAVRQGHTGSRDTYGATLLVAFGQAVVPAVVVAALATEVVANNLNVVVERRSGGGGSILED